MSFTLRFWIYEDRVRRVPLREDRLLLGEREVLPALANGCEERVGIELAILARQPVGNHLGFNIKPKDGFFHNHVAARPNSPCSEFLKISRPQDLSNENGQSSHVSYLAQTRESAPVILDALGVSTDRGEASTSS